MEDAEEIAKVHVESSITTYGTICPEILRNRVSVEERARMWRGVLPDPNLFTLLATGASGGVVGFASGGKERSGELGHDGELYAAYLLERVQRQGLGRQLVRRFARGLRERGFASMAVWVLAVNPSRKFYEALGGQAVARKTIEFGGRSFEEIAYGWSELDRLIAGER